ncbi:hypothetical protein Peur_055101 [Populus x canadensis]
MQPLGHRRTLMKAPVIGFQILLFMRLEGTSPGAEHFPCLILCSTFFDSRSWGFAVYRLVEKIVFLLNSGAGSGRYFAVTSNAQDYFGFLHNGSRLLGWWSVDEGSRKERARIYCAGGSGLSRFQNVHWYVKGYVGPTNRLLVSVLCIMLCYNTFPAEIVKKQPKSELVHEVQTVLPVQ